jgi:hypothetical protein
LSTLIKTFSPPQATIVGPLHPHLHSNGSQTHPIILIFNAIITQKRVIFIGHQKQASAVANYVLAACALASGSGCFLRGFIERAFPYVNLSAKDILDPLYVFLLAFTPLTNPQCLNWLHCWRNKPNF